MAEEKKIDPQVIKERIGKHLRTADEFTHFQRYEEALVEIELALKIDPKNNYARSFLERVKMMHKRTQEKETKQTGPVEMSLEERMAIISQHLSAAEEYINKKDYKHALDEVARVYKVDAKNYYAQAYSERIDTLMLEESAEGMKLFKTAIQQTEPAHSPVQSDTQQAPLPPPPERGSTSMYHELLKDVWLDGKVTEAEAQELATMRELFGITAETHVQLEHEVKIEAYLEALRIAWRDNIISDVEQKALQTMRDKYGITEEDQAIAEKRYDEIKRSSKSRGTVLLVDTDRDNLVLLGKVLKLRGFTIFMAQKAEDALQILITQKPTIIISEVLFPNSQLDGVGFFQKLREHSALKRTPFFFMSTIKDKKVIHASYRLGADQFLPKPVDTDLLLAMIDGRLRV
jgi:CheY-like chemotaxis protein